jgi:alpha-beta hydrolase superfamily lysophospholipase
MGMLNHLLSAMLAAVLLLAAAVPSMAANETLPRADGTSIVYHLDRGDAEARRGLILVLQGSGCEPVTDGGWIETEASLLAPGRAVLTIEKYGVAVDQPKTDFVGGCSHDYWAKNTLQQRVLDAAQVVARLRAESWWDRELIIYGGSEGGAVAAMLAPLVPETKAVVIVSSGIGVPVAELIRAAVPPPVAAQISSMLKEAKANPTGDKRFGGASYRWWADAADVTPAKALLQTDASILLIHGARDQYAPVSTARATQTLFMEAGKGNLTYREYESYDHFIKDRTGVDHRRAVIQEAADWLCRERLREDSAR